MDYDENTLKLKYK